MYGSVQLHVGWLLDAPTSLVVQTPCAEHTAATDALAVKVVPGHSEQFVPFKLYPYGHCVHTTGAHENVVGLAHWHVSSTKPSEHRQLPLPLIVCKAKTTSTVANAQRKQHETSVSLCQATER